MHLIMYNRGPSFEKSTILAGSAQVLYDDARAEPSTATNDNNTFLAVHMRSDSCRAPFCRGPIHPTPLVRAQRSSIARGPRRIVVAGHIIIVIIYVFSILSCSRCPQRREFLYTSPAPQSVVRNGAMTVTLFVRTPAPPAPRPPHSTHAHLIQQGNKDKPPPQGRSLARVRSLKARVPVSSLSITCLFSTALPRFSVSSRASLLPTLSCAGLFCGGRGG